VIEATASITLQVGESVININPAGVFIDGPIVLIKSGALAVPGTGSNPDGASSAQGANRAVDHNNPNTEDIEYDGTVGGNKARHPLETEAPPPEIEADDAIEFKVKDNKEEPEAAGNLKKTKAERLKEREALIAKAKEKASQPGIAGTEKADALNAAADRLAMNNSSVERAKLADNVYNREGSPPAPEGWKRIEDIATEEDKKQSFHAAVYEAEDGTKVLVFEGTSSGDDWKANGKQAAGFESYQYTRAMNLSKEMKKKYGSDLELAGHSLGGGLASAGAGVTGLKTSTYNSAGLHPNTVEREGGTLERANENVTSRHVRGEILTGLQQNGNTALMLLTRDKPYLWPFLPEVAEAAGDLSTLEPVLEGSTVEKHGMDHVIAAIEGEKKQDQTFMERAISGEEVTISVKRQTRRGSRQSRMKVKY